MGGSLGSNALSKYGLDLDQLNILNEYSLITSSDISLHDYNLISLLFCIRANPNLVLPRFLFYFFNTPVSRGQIDLKATGTTVLGIRQPDLRELPIIVPPLPTQCKIAAVLSAYDDLIENNTRRIKILEGMAQTLYREWFVHFRFLGHENVPMVESPLGPIPQGWKVVRASEVIFINPKTSVPRDTIKPFVPMKSATENSMLITEIGEKTGNSGAKFKSELDIDTSGM